jgi:hypothetical protein
MPIKLKCGEAISHFLQYDKTGKYPYNSYHLGSQSSLTFTTVTSGLKISLYKWTRNKINKTKATLTGRSHQPQRQANKKASNQNRKRSNFYLRHEARKHTFSLHIFEIEICF